MGGRVWTTTTVFFKNDSLIIRLPTCNDIQWIFLRQEEVRRLQNPPPISFLVFVGKWDTTNFYKIDYNKSVLFRKYYEIIFLTIRVFYTLRF